MESLFCGGDICGAKAGEIRAGECAASMSAFGRRSCAVWRRAPGDSLPELRPLSGLVSRWLGRSARTWIAVLSCFGRTTGRATPAALLRPRYYGRSNLAELLWRTTGSRSPRRSRASCARSETSAHRWSPRRRTRSTQQVAAPAERSGLPSPGQLRRACRSNRQRSG